MYASCASSVLAQQSLRIVLFLYLADSVVVSLFNLFGAATMTPYIRAQPMARVYPQQAVLSVCVTLHIQQCASDIQHYASERGMSRHIHGRPVLIPSCFQEVYVSAQRKEEAGSGENGNDVDGEKRRGPEEGEHEWSAFAETVEDTPLKRYVF